MKLTLDQTSPAPSMTVGTTPATLYQIFRQTRAGVFGPCFQSDSPVISVEAYLRQSPAFAGGEIRLQNHRGQRTCAAVKWTYAKPPFGFHGLQREDVFYDRRFAELTREVQVQEYLSAPKWLDPAMA